MYLQSVLEPVVVAPNFVFDLFEVQLLFVQVELAEPVPVRGLIKVLSFLQYRLVLLP